MSRSVAVVVLCLVAAAAIAQDDATPAPAPASTPAPAGWTLEGEVEVPAEGLRLFEGKLGGKLTRIANRTYTRHGFRAQVNEVECPTDEDAEAVARALVSAHGSPDFVVRRGRTILEFAKSNLLLAKALRVAMGLGEAGQATWEVEFRLACAEKVDAARANRVANLFAALEKRKDDPRIEAEIRSLSKDFVYGRRVRLLTPRDSGAKVEWTLDPKPARATREDDTTVYEMAAPPTRLGIPYVQVYGKIMAPARFRADGAPEAGGRLAETPRWPAGRADVRALAARLAGDAAGDRQKLEALQGHVFSQIATKGETGSRHGVEKVLAQKFGHCWDKSDLLVTLARASGLPTRQVAGWVPPLSAGHVWCEVFLRGEGWIPVDPTTAWPGTSEDYVSFFLTEDGEMPILYVGWPKVVRVR